jgi:N-hydroxyarylamine O-acetyltransferase
VNVDAYLERIAYRGPRQPTLETLSALHRAHMLAVPFENLDIHLGRWLVLDRDANFEKIVVRRRGGWCYELNGLFGLLLERLGFDVTLLGARVVGEQVGRELGHLMLRVDLERPWLADVGFGDSSLEPLPLGDAPTQAVEAGGLRREFELVPRRLEEFAAMCEYSQTSPDITFTQRRLCTLATAGGRVTLSDLRLIERDGDRVSERELGSEDEWRRVLRERFAIVLDP